MCGSTEFYEDSALSNSMGLIYREFTPDFTGQVITVPTPSNVFTAVRKSIKPFLPELQMKPNNQNGAGAAQFHRRLGRFRFHWLEFLLPEYVPLTDDYPTDQTIVDLGILKETEVATLAQWRETLVTDAAQGDIYLLVGLEAMINKSDLTLSMLHSGIPSRHWPLDLKVHECVITNAPICQYLRFRSHVLV